MGKERYEKIILQALDTKYAALQSLHTTLHEDEFQLTKFLLRNKLLLDLQKQFDRIEEHVKSFVYFRSPKENGEEYWNVPLEMDVLRRAEGVMTVQKNDVKDLLKRILKSPSGIFHLGIHNCKLPDQF